MNNGKGLAGRAAQYVAILAFGLSATLAAMAAERRGDALVFEVPALPEIKRHVELLGYPPYLALALENVGLSPSYSSRLVVSDPSSFELGKATVRFRGRKGDVFLYEGEIKIPLGVTDSSYAVRVEVDTSEISAGKMTIRAFPGVSKMLPQELLDRVEFKIRALASADAQRRVLAYLDDVSKPRSGGARAAPDKMIETILTDAYNRSSTAPGLSGGREPGDAEPLSDQILLIATLAIWIVCLPLALFGRFWAIRRAARKSDPPSASA